MKQLESVSEGRYLDEKVLVRVFSRKKQKSGWNSEGELTTAKPVLQDDRMLLINLQTDRTIHTSCVVDARWDGDTLYVSTMNTEYSLQPIKQKDPIIQRDVSYISESIAKASKKLLEMLGF